MPQVAVKEHRARRARLAATLRNGVALFGSAKATGHADPYRPDPDLYYLTGMDEPSCALSLTFRDGKIEDEVLYCRERDPRMERWEGERLGPIRAQQRLGIARAKKWQGVESLVAEHQGHGGDMHLKFDKGNPLLGQCLRMLSNGSQPTSAGLRDARGALATLRMVKDRHEVELIRKASEVTARAMERVRLGIGDARSESDLSALISHEYESSGALHAFRPIVACGRNACVAHYVANSAKLSKGKLLLVDTGASLGNYTSDMTRTYPVGGSYGPAQQDLYSIVLEAQKSALGTLRPGRTMQEAQHKAAMVMAKGLAHLGICKGPASRIVSSGEIAEHFFHSIGHMVGIEVHDAQHRFDKDGKPTKLQQDMVVTIEPGLYLDGRSEVPKEIRNTGVRIEDTALITKSGHEVLTGGAPKEVSQIVQSDG